MELFGLHYAGSDRLDSSAVFLTAHAAERHALASIGGYAYGATPGRYYRGDGERQLVRPLNETELCAFWTRGTKAPIWEDESFWPENSDIWEDHFPHVDPEDSKILRFAESPSKGARGLFAKIKPGRYLKRFFGDILTDVQIDAFASWFIKGELPPLHGFTLEFASTSRQIVEVYSEGPSSCMQGADCVSVYGAGDLAIAYLTSDTYGSIDARALCWPAKQVFGRVYGDESDSLFAELKRRGFVSINENKTCFDGARIKKVSDWESSGYVMPYLDNSYGVNDEGDCFVMKRYGAEYDCDSTDGVICGERYESECENCGDGTNDYNEVVTRFCFTSRYADATQGWCDSCAENHAFYCEGSQLTVSNRIESVEVDGNTWAEPYAQENAYQWADGTWSQEEEPEEESEAGEQPAPVFDSFRKGPAYPCEGERFLDFGQGTYDAPCAGRTLHYAVTSFETGQALRLEAAQRADIQAAFAREIALQVSDAEQAARVLAIAARQRGWTLAA